MQRALVLCLVLMGCGGDALPDFDGDLVPDSIDCAPTDAAVFQGAPDPWGDGLDTNCDGLDGTDGDGDGYAVDSDTAADCNDADPNLNPATPEIPDEVDNDCDGVRDEGTDGFDDDGDGFCEGYAYEAGSPLRCADGAASPGDCDDLDALRTPADADADGDSTCGDDCNDADPEQNALDADGDGFSTCTGDCDDAAPGVNPGATEVCDLTDNDCDGAQPADEVDADGDTDPACSDCDDADPGRDSLDRDQDTVSACDGDCNDALTTWSPLAPDVANDGLDQNCDGVDGIDGDGDGAASAASLGDDCDDTDPALNQQDADADGSSTCDGDCDDADPSVEVVDADGDGVTTCAADCDDAEPLASPLLTETCDLIDNDCDGTQPADEVDGDGDGEAACSDCDDTEPTMFTGNPEVCDALDNDCDGAVPIWGPNGEIDNDGDGYAECSGDCSDFVASINPGAVDGCDGVDTNCNGVIDDMNDADGDGWCAGDCDDTDPALYPGQWDPNGGADLDCDGTDVTGLAYPTVTIQGEQAQSTFALSVSGIGDVDGDGFEDFAAGAPNWSATSNSQEGRVYVFLGGQFSGSTTLSASAANVIIEGALPGDQLGRALTGAGDVDGDGLDDLLVGAPEGIVGTTRTGYALLVPGSVLQSSTFLWSDDPAAVRFEAEDGGDQAGFSVAGVGNVDGDTGGLLGQGLDDLVICSPERSLPFVDRGRCYVVLGAQLGSSPIFPLANAWTTVDGETAGDLFGTAVAGVPDLDGDSLPEVLFGATQLGRGRAYLFLGVDLAAPGSLSATSAHATWEGEDNNDRAGHRVGALGDLDGDGLSELLVTAWRQSYVGATARGAAYVIDGADALAGTTSAVDLATVWWQLSGSLQGDNYGFGAATRSGDADADGVPDVLVGAYGSGFNGLSSGTTYLHLGPQLVSGSGGRWAVSGATHQFVGAALQTTGRSVAWVDANGDGRDDVLIGTTEDGSLGPSTGALFLLLSEL